METNAHQLVRAAIPAQAQKVDERGDYNRPARHEAHRRNPRIYLAVLPCRPGQKLEYPAGGDPDPTLKISSTPKFLLDGAGTSQGLSRTLVLNPEIQEAVLHITARAAACDGTPDGDIPEHAACHPISSEDWGIPVIGHR